MILPTSIEQVSIRTKQQELHLARHALLICADDLVQLPRPSFTGLIFFAPTAEAHREDLWWHRNVPGNQECREIENAKDQGPSDDVCGLRRGG
jgi:hypothetical protein